MKAVGALVLAATVAGCDPIWSVDVSVRSPATRPVPDATVALVCPPGIYDGHGGLVALTDAKGVTHVSGMGFGLPTGCDLMVAKPGFRTVEIRYAELCPEGRGRCDRIRQFDLVLIPEEGPRGAAEPLLIP
ncbi:MAG: hypothetical protein R3B06_32065 [Kofleriaceae bacterium]